MISEPCLFTDQLSLFIISRLDFPQNRATLATHENPYHRRSRATWTRLRHLRLKRLLHFIPMPELPQNLAGDYTRVFLASGYVYFIGGLLVIGGLLLLVGRFVPLALTILGAIIVNILIFHALMAPEGFPPALVFTALELFLVWRYREAFIPLLRP